MDTKHIQTAPCGQSDAAAVIVERAVDLKGIASNKSRLTVHSSHWVSNQVTHLPTRYALGIWPPTCC
jgi:hypothetical protein